MAVPHSPHTLFPDSIPVMEISSPAAWPGDNIFVQSDVYDVVDFLPALRANGTVPADAFMAGSGTNFFPDPRFVLDYYLFLQDANSVLPLGLGTPSRIILSVVSGCGPVSSLSNVFSLSHIGQPTQIEVGPTGGPSTKTEGALHGSVRITGRQLFFTLGFYGNAPNSFSVGAYLRIY